MAVLVVWTAVPDKRTAGKLAGQIVAGRLAACVTVLPAAVSVYRWKGKTTKARECVLMIKTTRSRWKALQSFVLRRHPYELPELICTTVSDGSKEYLKWIES